jgi:hypothetical protein
MEILIPEPRVPRRNRSLLWAVALCVPSLVVWAMVGLEWSGVSRAVGEALGSVPGVLLAAITLGGPLAAGVISSVGVVHGIRAGQSLDRRQVALAAAAFLIAAVTASAAIVRGS